MTKRKSPVKHRVKAHEKEDGTKVKSHVKGSGTTRKVSVRLTKRGMISEHDRKVYAQYEAIRLSGQVNMFMKHTVQRIAFENGFYELVNAIEERGYVKILKDYGKMIPHIKDSDIPTARKLVTTYSLE